MSEKFVINLKIAGKQYPVTIRRDKEETYRRAEREINALFAAYKANYRGEEEDYMVMTVLQIAAKNVEMEMSRSLGDDIDKLVELEQYLDNQLTDKD